MATTFTSTISRVAPGVFSVQGRTGLYMVRRSSRSCTCPSFVYRSNCRHLGEVRAWALEHPAVTEQAPQVAWLQALGVAA